jgi:hypothetical protein
MFGFFGHGSWNNPVWLIGAEHGSPSEDAAELEREVGQRVMAWIKCGSSELTDWHESAEVYQDDQRWLYGKPPIQSTYGRLIRFLLAYKSSVSRDEVRNFQASRLGRAGGKGGVSIIEFRPLPSKNLKQWFYPKFTKLACLKTRARYYEAVDGPRVKKIVERASKYSPRLVVLYGADAGRALATELAALTEVVEIPHPSSHQKADFFRSQGSQYAETLRSCLGSDRA